METQNKFHLCILTLFIYSIMWPETESSSALHIELNVEGAAFDMTVNDDALRAFKDCTCNSGEPNCYLISQNSYIDNVNTGTGYKIMQLTAGETGSQYTYFSCRYINFYAPIRCDRKSVVNYICDCATTRNVLLGLKCQGNPNVFTTWDVTQDAWVREYNTTEIDLIECCSSATTGNPISSSDRLTTGERPDTTAADNAADIATTSIKPTRTTRLESTTSHIPTAPYDNKTIQNQHEQCIKDVAEFSPACIGLIIGVCVATAVVSVLITSLVMIKWHQRQAKIKSSKKPNRSHEIESGFDKNDDANSGIVYVNQI